MRWIASVPDISFACFMETKIWRGGVVGKDKNLFMWFSNLRVLIGWFIPYPQLLIKRMGWHPILNKRELYGAN